MELIRYLNAYFAFSFLGWVWESIYCTIDARKWQNRGFFIWTIMSNLWFWFNFRIGFL